MEHKWSKKPSDRICCLWWSARRNFSCNFVHNKVEHEERDVLLTKNSITSSLFIAWLRLSSHNSNKQQAIQTGLKRRKSIKRISSKLIELKDNQTRRVVETVNSYQEVQPCFFYILASFWTFACTEMDGIWQLHSFFSEYYLIKSPPTVWFTGSRPDQMSPSGTLTKEENHI